jgi:hypothetical protein
MYTPHMIPKVPMAWEAVISSGTVAVLIRAEERFVAVSVHGMSFSLVAQQTCSGREVEILTGDDLTPIWL